MCMRYYEKGLEEPHNAWDRYCENQERMYQALIEDKTCEDCSNCDKPGADFDNEGRIGYCRDAMDFVSLDDTPKEIGCEAFEE